MTSQPHTIMLVDDSELAVEILILVLEAAPIPLEYLIASSGEEALELARESPPDLILLDVTMPGIDGYTTCQRIKEDERLADIPLIFVTGRDSEEDLVHGFEAGGVDYIIKPYREAEVLARVQTHLRLHDALREIQRLGRLALDANPLTQLPGNNTVAQSIQSAIDAGRDATVIYADLDHFKAYNDHYGFSSGDEVIRFTSQTLARGLDRYCATDEAFLGHIGGDDFVVILPTSTATPFGEWVVRQFDDTIAQFYSEEDRERGTIVVKDRRGIPTPFPLISISMAGVRLSLHSSVHHHLEISNICADIKKKAKACQGSVLVLDSD